MVNLVNISKRYPNGVHALNEINIKIQKGEFVYVIGTTGSGKSTLIKIINSEIIPSAGEAFISDINVGKLSHRAVPKYRQKIGVVFQDFRLIKTKTIFENVFFALEVIGMDSKKARVRVREVLQLTGIADKANSFPDELSGGQQQRAAIARAIANNPRLLIADEPTGNLDPLMSREIIALLEKINKEEKTTIIMVTHDDSIVNEFKKRTIILDSGYVASDSESGGYLNERQGLADD
ncbi:MAG: ATP-binding cassette domain-containing protein [Erysipelothrix sp.]|nr:ATP-binding cassette domain-containing protein [Erysipelothrix sp.]